MAGLRRIKMQFLPVQFAPMQLLPHGDQRSIYRLCESNDPALLLYVCCLWREMTLYRAATDEQKACSRG